MQQRRKLFFLINSMESGGAEKVLSNILPELSEKYEIYLLLLKNEVFFNISNNIKVIPLANIHTNLLIPFFFPWYIWRLKKIKKKHQPYKIISSLELANFINILINKQAIVSFETSLYFFQKTLPAIIYKKCIYSLYPKSTLIKVNSKENKFDLAEKLSIPLDKIITIHNPINFQMIEKLKKEVPTLPFKPNFYKKIFITIGRLDSLKNISAIIRAFKRRKQTDALLIIGDGQERQSLEQLIAKHNLSKQVFLLGRKKNVYKYLNIADYFVFASKTEGFPNVLLEAMACHLPIITSDFKTGAREVIDPGLNFTKKIKYPYYGPNGALLSIDNFEKDFQKIDFVKLKQKQVGLEKFKLKKIVKQWENILQ
jgi:N-acetylgalactosamine-N,N'-diacetylbacillosaminyl-diphospho-undecaprenol 4-alpha-N-acetylgalactosaminyltransferase